MNISAMIKMGPTGGETFTVTCFACGMPSSKEWAQRVRSRPHVGIQEPFYPFLLEKHAPPPGAIVMEDGSTYLCAFCNALLESQWNTYETKGDSNHMERKYVVRKFICAVCAIETYRKRVRALPFQEFPFLITSRQPGSITLGNNPLAVVCLDCSETLWAQSAEYDRWGLPVHKRHFNWMARPPPPEDSVEATVARLPSGETQLPRCPPTDPLVPPRTNEPTAMPEPIPPVKSNRLRNNGGNIRVDSAGGSGSRESRHRHHHQQQSGSPINMNAASPGSSRKISMEGMNHPVLDSPHGQPPVVTVAPISSQHTLTNTRKNSMSYPTSGSSGGGMSGSSSQGQNPQSKYGGLATRQSPSTHTHGGVGVGIGSLGSGGSSLSHHQYPFLFPQSHSYPPSGPFPWPPLGGMESHGSGGSEIPRHAAPFGHLSLGGSGEHHPWPWFSHTSPELLRYHQSYLASLQGAGLADSYFQAASAMYPPSSSIHIPTSSAYSLPHAHVQSQSTGLRSAPSPQTYSRSSPSYRDRPERDYASPPVQSQSHLHEYHSVAHAGPRTPGSASSGSATPPQHHQVQYHHTHKNQKYKSSHSHSSDEASATVPVPPPKPKSPASSTSSTSTITARKVSTKPSSGKPTTASTSPEHQQQQRLHWKHKKSSLSGFRKTSSKSEMKAHSSGGGDGTGTGRRDILLPKKRRWQPPSETLTSSSTSTSETNVSAGGSGSSAKVSGSEDEPQSQSHKSVLEKKRKFSMSASALHDDLPLDFTAKTHQHRKGSVPHDFHSSLKLKSKELSSDTLSLTTRASAMDLSVSAPTTTRSSIRPSSCPSSSAPASKFSIAYLSQSESVVEEAEVKPPKTEGESTVDNTNSSAERTSVIVSVPQGQDVKKDNQEDPTKETEEIEGESKTDEKPAEEGEAEEAKTTKSDKSPERGEPSQEAEGEIVGETTTPTEAVVDNPTPTEPESEKTEQKENVEESETELTKSEEDKDSEENVTQVGYVTIGEIRLDPAHFVRKTIEDFLQEEDTLKKMEKERFKEQLGFLSHLGLITPEKKSVLELEALAQRSERKTIPPLKMRVKSPPISTIDEKLEQTLLEAAFDDPSLKVRTPIPPEKKSFLTTLGLKPCTRVEKSRREVEWRQLLNDRMSREKRNPDLQCVYTNKPWNSHNRISKLLAVAPRSRPSLNSTGTGTRQSRGSRSDSTSSSSSSENLPMSCLTLILPTEGEVEDINGIRRNSSDLLTTVDAGSIFTHLQTNNQELPSARSSKCSKVKKNRCKGTCINYPKYVPSYALNSTCQSTCVVGDKDVNVKEEATDLLEDGEQTTSVQMSKSVEILNVPVPSTSTNNFGSSTEPILKIPMVSKNMPGSRRGSNSTVKTTTSYTSSDDEYGMDYNSGPEFEPGNLVKTEIESFTESETKSILNTPSNQNLNEGRNWSDVENILRASTAQWEKTKKVMEEALNQTDYLKSKENRKVLDEQAAKLRTIRKYLKTQQADMRQTEKLFKGMEKRIVKKLRNFTKSDTNPNPSTSTPEYSTNSNSSDPSCNSKCNNNNLKKYKSTTTTTTTKPSVDNENEPESKSYPNKKN